MRKTLAKFGYLSACILLTCAVAFAANCYWLFRVYFSPISIALTAALFLAANILPWFLRNLPTWRLRFCHHGALCLKIFLAAAALSVIHHIVIAFYLFPAQYMTWILSAVVCICALAILFWNGILSIYLSSVQLGIRNRAIGILCSCIPLLNIFVLAFLIRTVGREVQFESEKIQFNRSRKDRQICATKYPILLVHGVFFRDMPLVNYWGRIPNELKQNGAQIFYGKQQSAASVDDCAQEICARIREILQETGAEKVNLIGHSKGGLDCRRAVTLGDTAAHVASLTTVNTPHRGCEFADYLLEKVPSGVQQKIAGGYNAAMRKFGDPDPDFMAAVQDLTASRCRAFNDATPDCAGIYYQSVGSQLDRAGGGKFPLNLTYLFVKRFDGPNDGLVSESSFPWGAKFTMLRASGKRGISHGDVVDLNRENIPGFDVREFYVQLVADLKERGF